MEQFKDGPSEGEGVGVAEFFSRKISVTLVRIQEGGQVYLDLIKSLRSL